MGLSANLMEFLEYFLNRFCVLWNGLEIWNYDYILLDEFTVDMGLVREVNLKSEL